MNITIIGAGSVGGALGTHWAAKGHAIVYGVRRPSDAKVAALVAEAKGKARAAELAASAREAEAVVLATPWTATEDAIRAAGGLAGKVVLDATNPLALGPAGLGLAVGHSTSGGETVQRWAPAAKVVKTLNTTGFGNMADTRYAGAKPVMFYCGDDPAAKRTAHTLVGDLGFDGVDAGPLAAARQLEPMALLWINLANKQGLGRDIAFALLRR
jgi:hypothetical protein